MKKNLSVIFIIILFCVFLAGISAQNLPSLEPDPRAAEYAARAARGLSWIDLAEISLWASGADPYAIPQSSGGRNFSAAYMEIIHQGVNELLSDPGFTGSSAEKGDFILNFIHKKYLNRYSIAQTRLDTLLVNGSYNCVSSAVLYVIFATAAGFRAEGVITRDHAFARFFTEGGEIDVETTNAYGFDPGTRKEFHDSFGRSTGFSYISSRNYRDRADISALELVSLIFNNLIYEFESRNRFEEALPLALNRHALLSFNTARVYPELFIDPNTMVTDRIFNYGSMLIRQGRETDALVWANAASRFPDPRWLEFIDASVNNLMAKLMRANDYTEAGRVLNENRYRISPALYSRLESVLNSNRIADLHNAFAAAYNRRDYVSAREIIDRALEEFPDNRQLLADKELADRALH